MEYKKKRNVKNKNIKMIIFDYNKDKKKDFLMEYNSSEFLIETEVPSSEVIISRTDLNGNITFVNEIFTTISGYTEEEMIGKPHNILRHPDMPKVVFEEMWETLRKTQRWEGIVKNKRKDDGFYWVNAMILGVFKDGELVEYKSVRLPINDKQKAESQKRFDKLRKETNDTTRTIIYK